MSSVKVFLPVSQSSSQPGSGVGLHAENSLSLSPKIQPWHLTRRAIVYVRQSTTQQVINHRESTSRQYALVDRAVALGWPRAQVLVIDEDQGQSGQSAEGRPGFQRLLAEVGLDHVGLVLGLEMSRLARSCKDWHQLLELCAIFRALLADQDELYDPMDFNDRLLLGLKGTMSEAELHILKGRMYQGRLNKAKRGELLVHAPIGYIQLPSGDFAFDPDEQSQGVVRLIFAEFARQGSLYALLRYLVDHAIRLPVRPLYGSNRGKLEWRRPCRATLQTMLHHPIYAGAYRYGHRKTDPRKKVPGRRSTGRTINRPEDCLVLIQDRFPAYISWEQFEKNQERLAQNQARAAAMGAPRNGPSLLGGLLYCGRCGRRLMVQYSGRANRLRYQCGHAAQRYGAPICFGTAGRELDNFVAERVLKVLEPASLELCLAAMDDLDREHERLDQHWRQQIERTRYNVDRLARQYHAVEPENRLVARTLEQQWEEALREQEQLTAEYETFRREQPAPLTDDQRILIRRLSQDIPAMWHAPDTTSQDRQQIVRLLLDRIDVNAENDNERMDLTMHWAGGFTSRHQYTRSVASYDQLSNLNEMLARIVMLRQTGRTLVQVAEQLNREGFRPPKRSCRFTAQMLSRFLLKRGLNPRRAETLAGSASLHSHEWWLKDLACYLNMPAATLNRWRRVGWVAARKVAVAGGRWALWADESEMTRLRCLRSHPRGWSDNPYPQELTIPKIQSEE